MLARLRHPYEGGHRGGRLDGDTILVSLDTIITDITSKTLHEKTGQVLDRLRRGERFRVLRDGEPEALMVPVEEAIDPEWPEIMAEVLAARKQAKSVRENPILKERKARNYAACGPVTPSQGLWHPPRG